MTPAVHRSAGECVKLMGRASAAACERAWVTASSGQSAHARAWSDQPLLVHWPPQPAVARLGRDAA